MWADDDAHTNVSDMDAGLCPTHHSWIMYQHIVETCAHAPCRLFNGAPNEVLINLYSLFSQMYNWFDML